MDKIPPYFVSFHMKNTILSIDKALEFVGDNSLYQKRVMLLFSFQWVLYSFFMMGLPFLFATPLFLCEDSKDPLIFYNCFEAEACNHNNGFKIDENISDSTISSDFLLFCDRRFWIGLCESLFFLGSTLGSIIFPLISNYKGRKLTLMASIIITGASIILVGVSINIYMVSVFLFFAGVGFSGFEATSYVFLNEISAERFRNISLVSLTAVWALAQIIYTPISYYIGNWRIICIGIIGLPFLFSFIPAFKFLVETPRYLLSRKKFTEARIILNSIALYNRRCNFDYLLEGETNYEGYDLDIGGNKTLLQAESDPYIAKINYNYLDIFRYPSLRKITFFMFLLWFFRYFTYFGFTFSLASFGAELHQNFLLTAIGEFIACIISAPIKFKFTRVKSLFLTALISSLASIILIFFPIPNYCYSATEGCYEKTLTVILAIIIKFSISIFGSILLNYTGEIYPTVVRSLGYGVALSMGKFVSISMPIIVNYIQIEEINPLIIFGFFGIFVAGFITRMNETYGRDLPNYIEETKRKKSNENKDLLLGEDS